MNCVNCNMPLEPYARFCRNCGRPVSTDAPGTPPTNPIQNSMSMYDAPTEATAPAQMPPQQQWSQPQSASQQQPQSAPQQPYYQPTVPVVPGTMQSAGSKGRPATVNAPAPRRRRRLLLGCLLSFVIVVLVLGAAWFVGIRPYLHSVAADQLNQSLAAAIASIPPDGTQAPPGPLAVKEIEVNNLIMLNSAPSDPVQHVQVHFTQCPADNNQLNGCVRVDFQALGFPCTVSGVPVATGGRLVINQVKVEGIVALIMSPDELTTLIDARLHDAQVKLGHAILSVVMKDQEIDLILGPSGSFTGSAPGENSPTSSYALN